MASLLTLNQLGKSQGGRKLFEKISFGIEERDNIALIGPNGAGKTTLLNILAKKMESDEGEVFRSRSCRLAYLEQSPEFNAKNSLLETVLEKADPSFQDPGLQAKAYSLISKMGFDDAGIYADINCNDLSGGWQKKAALARELLTEPNLLLLDEPTNHLDIKSIIWLENFLNDSNFATLMITHDRSFLQNTSSVIVELNRCYSTGFLKIEGDYAEFCRIKSDIIGAQAQAEQSAKQKLIKEIAWMKKSPKARTTKQRARMKRTDELEEAVQKMQYRNIVELPKIAFKAHDRAPKKLITAKAITKSFSGKTVFDDIDLLVANNSRIGLIGANGSGKSTLIKALLGKIEIDSGKIQVSEALESSYFQQDKELENVEMGLLAHVSEAGDKLNYCGQWIDARSYLARFAFSKDQHTTKVKELSGGEKSRLLIAKLMLNSSNLLVLDEPTNDLDLETLNILEDELENYGGSLILVSHDRYFLDQVCDEILAFSPDPEDHSLTRFADIHQWQRWHEEEVAKLKRNERGQSTGSIPQKSKELKKTKTAKKKLSFKEKYELENMESNILAKEDELASLTMKLEDCSSGADSSLNIADLSRELARVQEEVDRLYSRWDELSKIQG